jgi:hypothetical protein
VGDKLGVTAMIDEKRLCEAIRASTVALCRHYAPTGGIFGNQWYFETWTEELVVQLRGECAGVVTETINRVKNEYGDFVTWLMAKTKRDRQTVVAEIGQLLGENFFVDVVSPAIPAPVQSPLALLQPPSEEPKHEPGSKSEDEQPAEPTDLPASTVTKSGTVELATEPPSEASRSE